jgi:hypothetical protein
MRKSSQYRRLRKNPLVRLLRQIYQFFHSIFKSRTATFRSHRSQRFSDRLDAGDSTTTAATQIDRMPTIGEILDRVNWQFAPSATPEKHPDLNRNTEVKTANINRSTTVETAPHKSKTVTSIQVDRIKNNESMTIGELFEKVKWQHPPGATQSPGLNPRKTTRTFDNARN